MPSSGLPRVVVGRCLSALALLLAVCPSTVTAQPLPCNYEDQFAFAFPQLDTTSTTPNCAATGNIGMQGELYQWQPNALNPMPSACWWGMTTPQNPADVSGRLDPRLEGLPLGGRLNINLLAFPSPGNFLPPAPTLAQSSCCLVPSSIGDLDLSWQGTGRPTLHQTVDLITGVPLVQVTDLELPFDGANFRLTRTRSNTANAGWAGGAGEGMAQSALGGDIWWDWTGEGWMVGESPVLIWDAALPDVIGDQPRTCWLVLDAHHSIPFQFIEDSTGAGRYEAPPRFRARLEPKGGTVALNGNGKSVWTTNPSQFDVYLYDGALRYTFVAIAEDIPEHLYPSGYLNNVSSTTPDTVASYHERPYLFAANDPHAQAFHSPYAPMLNPGFGVPHYAICTKIEDTLGHMVEIGYCDSVRSSLDDPGTADCVECVQDCAARGQIKYVKLKTLEEGNLATHWTLVYGHRRFAFAFDELGLEAPWVAPGTTLRRQIEHYRGATAINSIYVFEGDVADSVLAPLCLTTSHEVTHTIEQGDDPLYSVVPAPISNTGLRYEVRYHYQTDANGKTFVKPLLLKTSVRTYSAEDQAEISRSNQVYHYDHNQTVHVADIRWLECISITTC